MEAINFIFNKREKSIDFGMRLISSKKPLVFLVRNYIEATSFVVSLNSKREYYVKNNDELNIIIFDKCLQEEQFFIRRIEDFSKNATNLLKGILSTQIILTKHKDFDNKFFILSVEENSTKEKLIESLEVIKKWISNSSDELLSDFFDSNINNEYKKVDSIENQ